LPTAASISILETLALLDGPYAGVGTGVAQGSYAFWLGSGISRDRVIGLDGVLAKLLEFLRERVTASAACGYRAAFDKIIAMAAPSDDERAEINLAVPVTNWPCIENLLKRLWKQYSAVLSVEMPGERLDHLLWVGLNFPNTFACQPADAEHLAIAMLALEGTVTEFASANWDGLIEAAMRELGYDETFYRITVTGADLRNPAAAAILYKFHGCALRAIDKEDEYRSLLVARSLQIANWSVNDKFKIVRDQLGALVQTRRTLMIGLSAQDANIKHLFAAVNQHQGWQWTDAPTPIVISAQELGDDHKDLLGLVYGEESYEAHRDEICEAARLQAYAKPLLIALLLKVLTAKLEVLAADAHALGACAPPASERHQRRRGASLFPDRRPARPSHAGQAGAQEHGPARGSGGARAYRARRSRRLDKLRRRSGRSPIRRAAADLARHQCPRLPCGERRHDHQPARMQRVLRERRRRRRDLLGSGRRASATQPLRRLA